MVLVDVMVVVVLTVEAEFTLSVSLTFPVQPLESVAVTVIGKLPACVGVPLRTPAAKVMPVGKAPFSENVTVPTPPVCANVTAEYAAPTVPLASVLGVTVIAAHPAAIVSVYAWLPVSPIESVTVIVKGNVPVWVGVPESTPAEESVRPDGSAPVVTAKVTAPVPPAAASVIDP